MKRAIKNDRNLGNLLILNSQNSVCILHCDFRNLKLGSGCTRINDLLSITSKLPMNTLLGAAPPFI